MSVITIESEEQYQKLIKTSHVSVVLFAADWAEQCQQILDVFRELCAKGAAFGQLQFISIAAEDFSQISLNHQIEAVPTVLFFRSGSAVDRIDGIDIAALTAKCKELAGVVEDEKSGLEERLKKLINKSEIMVFVKGDRITPKCGFSKTLIGLLNELGCSYETFDILTDEAVRQGLKTFSDWPTYPQVYVKGELIGGLDIVKELIAAKEFPPV